MFASWVPSSTHDGSGVVLSQRPHVFNPTTAKTTRPTACHRCRTQKVRCTGEPDGSGCKRCQSLGKKCTYPPNQTSANLKARPRRVPCQRSPTTTTSGTFTPASLAPAADWLADGLEQQHDDSLTHDEAQMPDDILDSIFMDSCEEAHSDNYTTQLEADTLISPGESATCTPDSLLSLNSQRQTTFSTDDPSVSAWVPHTQWQFTRAPEQETRGLQGPVGKDDQVEPGVMTPKDIGPDSCPCLQGVVNLMDELETITEAFPDAPCRSSADGLLTPHREALRQAEGMLACQSCTARVENMTILALLAGRLATLCRRAAAKLSSIAGSGTKGPVGVAVGTYRLESVAEYVAVMRTLLRLELRRLLALVGNVRLAGKHARSEAMARRLDGCERSALALLDSLGRECSL